MCKQRFVKKYRGRQEACFIRELTALALPQPVSLDLAPSVPHGVRPTPVFVKLLQALEVDRGEVGADPLPNPPLPLAGVRSPRSAEFVLEVFPSDPPLEKQSTGWSGGDWRRAPRPAGRSRTVSVAPRNQRNEPQRAQPGSPSPLPRPAPAPVPPAAVLAVTAGAFLAPLNAVQERCVRQETFMAHHHHPVHYAPPHCPPHPLQPSCKKNNKAQKFFFFFFSLS